MANALLRDIFSKTTIVKLCTDQSEVAGAHPAGWSSTIDAELSSNKPQEFEFVVNVLFSTLQ